MEAQTTQRGRGAGVIDTLMTFLRRVMLFVIFLAIAFLAAWFYAKQRIHEEIRQKLETQFAEHFAPNGLKFTIGSARLIEGEGIEIRHVRIRDASAEPHASELVHIDEIYIHCQATTQDLLTKPPPPAQRVIVRRPKFFAKRDAEGHWNLEKIWPLPKLNDEPAPLTFENAALDIDHGFAQPGSLVKLRDIYVTVTPIADRKKLKPWLLKGAPNANEPLVHLHGIVSSEHVEQINVEAVYDAKTSFFNAHGLISDLHLSSRLYDDLPEETMSAAEMLSAITGRVSMNFVASNRPANNESLKYSVTGKLKEGRIVDNRLPYPVTDITADLRCDNRGCHVENVNAVSGVGTIKAEFHRDGFHENAPYFFKVKGKQVELGERLADVLPDRFRESWDKFSPSGTIDADVSLSYDGAQFQPDVTIDCKNVSFAFYKFPYRVRACIGKISLLGNKGDIDVRGLVGGRVAHFDGKFENPGPDHTGELDITLDGPISLNEEFLSALKDEPQRMLRDFHARGDMTIEAHYEKKDPRQLGPDEHVTIGLIDFAIKHEKFPYPIERISGTLEMTNGEWEYRNIRGYNDSGTITCNGTFRRDKKNIDHLDLTFVGNAIALEDELRNALKVDMRKTWSDLRPRGTLDYLKVDFKLSKAAGTSSIEVTAHKELEEKEDIAGRGITLHPKWFSYRMDDVTGTVYFRDGEVTLEGLKARHGDTRLNCRGTCSFNDKSWKVWFQELTASRVKPDNDLIAALPGRLGDAITKLNLNGVMTLSGSMAMFGSKQPNTPVTSNWDINIDFEDSDIECGVELYNIRGGLHLVGDYSRNGFRSRGELSVDSMIYQDMHFTKIKGPMWMDDYHVAFGGWVKPPVGERPRRLTGKVFNSDMECDAQINTGRETKFYLQTLLRGADIKQVARDMGSGNLKGNKISGTANGELRLEGDQRGVDSLKGEGKIVLYDANIYEVPAMLAMLKLLKFKEPDTTAFTTSNMEFRIHGDDIIFDRIDFSGDSISLRGHGTMNLDSEIDFNFYTIVGRSEFVIPLISPLLGLASRQFLRIQIDGTLGKPNPPLREVLPGLSDALRRLFPELEDKEPLSNRPAFMRR